MAKEDEDDAAPRGCASPPCYMHEVDPAYMGFAPPSGPEAATNPGAGVPSLSDLAGKRVLVTGSSTGIGAAVALGFAGCGAKVAVHYHRSAGAAERLAADISGAGRHAVLVHGDLGIAADARAMVAAAADGLGGLDVLVNNAGGMVRPSPMADFDEALAGQVFGLNVWSIAMVVRAALPHLRAAGGGSIINTGSIAGRSGGLAGSGLYAAAKAAVHSLSRNMAREFAPDRIRVNTVAPGFIETPFHESTPEARKDTVRAAVPLGRLGTAEDCVGAYLFLASDSMSGYVTGQLIDVNGGWMMP